MAPRKIIWHEYEIELKARRMPKYDENDEDKERSRPYNFRGKFKVDAIEMVHYSLTYIGLDRLKKAGETRIGSIRTRNDRAYCQIFSPLPFDTIQRDCIQMYGDMAPDGWMSADLELFGTDQGELYLDFMDVKQKGKV